jgi:hypothetical protein
LTGQNLSMPVMEEKLNLGTHLGLSTIRPKDVAPKSSSSQGKKNITVKKDP